LPSETPASVGRVLGRCLERDPLRRLRDIGDARLELLAAIEGPSAAGIEEAAPRRSSRNLPALAGGAAALAGLALGWWVATAWAPRDGSAPPARIVSITQLTDQPGWQRSPELSPDGSHLLYVSSDGGDDDIFLLRVGGENAINLTADSPVDDFDPAFSPDGSSIVFTSRRQGGGIFGMGGVEDPLPIGRELGIEPEPGGRRIAFWGHQVVQGSAIFGLSLPTAGTPARSPLTRRRTGRLSGPPTGAGSTS
jgi:hypothetical protein